MLIFLPQNLKIQKYQERRASCSKHKKKINNTSTIFTLKSTIFTPRPLRPNLQFTLKKVSHQAREVRRVHTFQHVEQFSKEKFHILNIPVRIVRTVCAVLVLLLILLV